MTIEPAGVVDAGSMVTQVLCTPVWNHSAHEDVEPDTMQRLTATRKAYQTSTFTRALLAYWCLGMVQDVRGSSPGGLGLSAVQGGSPLVELRPFRRDELEIWQRFAIDPDAVGEFNWRGFRSMKRAVERFEEDGMLNPERSELAVVDEGQIVGVVQWLAGGYDGSNTGWCWRIGCTLLPEHRGRGIGTQAQRLLVEYLFATTPAVRIEADTDIENHAERACLEKIGFTQEGVLRHVGFRAGAWRDVARYSLLRNEM